MILKNGIIIRATEIDDLRSVFMMGLEEKSFTDPPGFWTGESLAELMATETTLAFTAARKKQILGFIAGSCNDKRMEILWLIVSPPLRRRGIGSALIDFLLGKASSRSIKQIFTRINENNLDTINLLCKKGLTKKNSFAEYHLT